MQEEIKNSSKKRPALFIMIFDILCLPIVSLGAFLSPMIFASRPKLETYLSFFLIISLPAIFIFVIVSSFVNYKKGNFERAFFIAAVPFILLILLVFIGMFMEFVKTIINFGR